MTTLKLNEPLLETKLAQLEEARTWSSRVISRLEMLIRTADDYALFRLNPLTYGVDLMRQTLLHSERHLLAPAQFAAWLDVAYLGAFALVCLALASALFGREEHLAPMMLGGLRRSGSAWRRPRSLVFGSRT